MRRFFYAIGLFVFGLAIGQAGLISLRAQEKTVDLDQVMKRVGPANGALRKSIEAMDANLAKESAATLRQAFADSEVFWKARGKADAQGWARDAGVAVEGIQKQIADSKWDEVKASAGALGKMCATCHAAYREKAEDGTYRMKPGD